MKIKLLTVVFCFALTAKSQNWHFQQSNAAYVALGGSGNLAPPFWWWGSSPIPIQLPFNLSIGSNSSSKWYITGSGTIINDTMNTSSSLLGFGLDLVDRSYFGGAPNQSPIQFQTVGLAPNRISIVSFSNAGIYYGDSTDFINFQIWIYETGHIIEYHYGASQFSGMSSNPSIGIGNQTQGTNIDYYLLDGLATSPSLVHVTNSANYVQVETPTDSMVYTFTPTTSPNHSSSNEKNNLRIYPNPCQSFIRIQHNSNQPTTCNIYQSTGACIYSEQTTNQDFQINTTHFPDGLYWITLSQNGTMIESRKILKHE